MITNLKHKPRGLAGIHETVRVFIVEEAFFTPTTIEWPKLGDISVTGDITTALPLVALTDLPSFVFSPQSGEAEYKKNKGNGPGYESVSHGPLKGSLVGDTKEQQKAKQLCMNRPGVVIAEYENGDRQVFGTLRKPMQILFDTKKSKEGAMINVSIESDWTYSFEPPLLGPAVVITELA